MDDDGERGEVGESVYDFGEGERFDDGLDEAAFAFDGRVYGLRDQLKLYPHSG